MSYAQILRRLNRVLKSTVNDVLDHLSREAQELHEFDEELRKSATGSQGARDQGRSGGADARSANRDKRDSGHSGQQQGSKQQSEGRRKPGERDDAHYYRILGLSPDATPEQIRKAYRTLMARYHPDRVATLGAGEQAAAAEKAKVISEAYQIIRRRRGMK
jgi:DnaJ-domain-containing protein 1